MFTEVTNCHLSSLLFKWNYRDPWAVYVSDDTNSLADVRHFFHKITIFHATARARCRPGQDGKCMLSVLNFFQSLMLVLKMRIKIVHPRQMAPLTPPHSVRATIYLYAIRVSANRCLCAVIPCLVKDWPGLRHKVLFHISLTGDSAGVLSHGLHRLLICRSVVCWPSEVN